MNIGIVILNWNGTSDTSDCISSLLSSTIPVNTNVEVVIVDNNSRDDSIKDLKKYIANFSTKKYFTVTLLESPENAGFSGGNNIGIRYLLQNNSSYILLLNNDTFVDKQFIATLVKTAESNPNALIGPKIYFSPGFEYHVAKYKKDEQGSVIWYAGGLIDWNNVYCSHRGVDEVDHGQYEKEEQTEFISGCALFAKADVYRAIGFLDEKYFMYFEDVDFCIRAKQKGYTILYDPSVKLWHKNAQSSGKSGSPLHIYYQTRNRLLFGMKYAPFKTKFALIRESMKLLIKNDAKREGVRDYFLGNYGKRY